MIVCAADCCGVCRICSTLTVSAAGLVGLSYVDSTHSLGPCQDNQQVA
jgi:hypothetical protein